MRDPVTHAAELIYHADSLVICAGAGMGVDSGLPDFRGNTGFWRAYPDLQAKGIRFEEVANPTAFMAHPAVAWEFYTHRIQLYRKTRPHTGFDILKRWCDAKAQGGFVYTSNVDGHFQKAGFSDDRVTECHGSLDYLQCVEPCGNHVWPLADDFDGTALPLCPHCGELARPNVLMFNDWGCIHDRAEGKYEALEAWLTLASNPLVIELGAGTTIPSVRRYATSLEIPIVRINPRDYAIEPPHIGLPMGALEGLLTIERAMKKKPLQTRQATNTDQRRAQA